MINENRMKLYLPVDKQQVDNSQDEIVNPKRRKTMIFDNSNCRGDSNNDVNLSAGRTRTEVGNASDGVDVRRRAKYNDIVVPRRSTRRKVTPA